MKDLRFGVIGVGGRGSLAHNAHKPDKGSRLVGCYDPAPEAIKAFKEFCGADKPFIADNLEQLLERKDIDAVFICSPDFLHEEQAIAALEAGKAVYLEKPMAITVEGCDRILETAYRTKSKLYLGHNMRHYPVILKMKEVIDSGIIGDIQTVWCRHFINYGGDAYFKDWHSEQEYSTSLLLQKGAHDIDIIHWLSGAYTESVVGMGKLSVYDKCAKRSEKDKGDPTFRVGNWPPLEQEGMSPKINVEDNSMILMQLSNGIQASYSQCHYTPDSMRNYTFIGTKGRVENIGDHGEAKVVVYTKRAVEVIPVPDIVYNMKNKTGSHGGSDPEIVQTFINFVKHNSLTNTSPVAARYSVAAGYMGADSIRNGSNARVIPGLSSEILEYFANGQC
jgi:predicted dehydrogenase